MQKPDANTCRFLWKVLSKIILHQVFASNCQGLVRSLLSCVVWRVTILRLLLNYWKMILRSTFHKNRHAVCPWRMSKSRNFCQKSTTCTDLMQTPDAKMILLSKLRKNRHAYVPEGCQKTAKMQNISQCAQTWCKNITEQIHFIITKWSYGVNFAKIDIAMFLTDVKRQQIAWKITCVHRPDAKSECWPGSYLAGSSKIANLRVRRNMGPATAHRPRATTCVMLLQVQQCSSTYACWSYILKHPM